MIETTELPFKFKFVRNGNMVGVRNRNGILTADSLILNGEPVPLAGLTDATSRDDRIVLVLEPGTRLGDKTRKELRDNRVLTIHVFKGKAHDLEKQIDRRASTIVSENNKQRLIAAGKGELYYAVVCPHCQATVDLSEMDVTPMIYCRFCGTILTKNLEVISDGDTYGVCEDCGFFDRINGYGILYFYFLLIAYGFHYQKRYLCDTCAQKAAVKALLVNLIFILGIPGALRNYFKARGGRDARWQNLAKANKLARAGDYTAADKIYDNLLMEHQQHPGVYMNQGLGHLYGKDITGATTAFKQSLKSARNYTPTQRLLYRLSQAAKAKQS